MFKVEDLVVFKVDPLSNLHKDYPGPRVVKHVKPSLMSKQLIWVEGSNHSYLEYRFDFYSRPLKGFAAFANKNL